MKAISLKQPWATWIREGHKTIESRTWSTKHRGPLLICASKQPDHYAMAGRQPRDFPLGCMICVAELVDCRLMTRDDEEAARCMWESGRWAWILKHVRSVKQVPIKGQLGLYDVADELIEPFEGLTVQGE